MCPDMVTPDGPPMIERANERRRCLLLFDGENSRQAAWIFRVAGLFRVAGVLGLPADRGSFPFAFFLFFGFFGFFFEGRMSHALIDKRCTENCAKAQLTVDISRTVEAPIEEIFIFE